MQVVGSRWHNASQSTPQAKRHLDLLRNPGAPAGDQAPRTNKRRCSAIGVLPWPSSRLDPFPYVPAASPLRAGSVWRSARIRQPQCPPYRWRDGSRAVERGPDSDGPARLACAWKADASIGDRNDWVSNTIYRVSRCGTGCSEDGRLFVSRQWQPYTEPGCPLFCPLDVFQNLVRLDFLFHGLGFRIDFYAELVGDFGDNRTQLGNLMLRQQADLQVEIRTAICFGHHAVLTHENKCREEYRLNGGDHRKHDQAFVPGCNTRNQLAISGNPEAEYR